MQLREKVVFNSDNNFEELLLSSHITIMHVDI